MDVSRKSRIMAFIVILIAVSAMAFYKNVDSNMQTAMVVRVVDGDTVVLDDGNKVRLLGINTPEHDAYYFKEAKEFLASMVENKTVKLESGVDDTDRYGRMLRYLFVNSSLVNLEILKNGYASAFMLEPDAKYRKGLIDAEALARERKIGIWEPSRYSGCIGIERFNYLEKNSDPDGEYFVLGNSCNHTIDFSRWNVKDEATHTYRFKGFLLRPGFTVTVVSGSGRDNSTHLFWNQKSPVWNNDGDTLYLRDADGRLVTNRTIGK